MREPTEVAHLQLAIASMLSHNAIILIIII